MIEPRAGASTGCTGHWFAENETCRNRLAEPHIIRQQYDRESPAERHQVLDLLLERSQPAGLPVGPRFDVLRPLDDDRIRKIPIERRFMKCEVTRRRRRWQGRKGEMRGYLRNDSHAVGERNLAKLVSSL